MKTFSIFFLLLGFTQLWSQKAELMPPLSHAKHVSVVAVSPDGEYVISGSGSSDNTAMMWSVKSGRLLKILPHKNPIREAAYSPDGSRIYTLEKNSGKLYLWSPDGLFLDTVVTEHFITSACFSNDSKRLLLGNSSEGFLMVHDIEGNGEQLISNETPSLQKVASSPDGKYYASGDEDGIIRVYQKDGNLKHTLNGHDGEDIRSLCFSPKSDFLLSAAADGHAVIWNVVTGKKERTLNGNSNPVKCARYSPDGKWISGVDPDDPVCCIWSTANFKLHKKFPAEKFGINDVIFAADGKSVFLCGFDRSAKQFDLEGSPLKNFINEATPAVNAQFSPLGTAILTGGSGPNLRLWNLNTDYIDTLPLKADFIAPAAFMQSDGSFVIGETGDKLYHVEMDTFHLKISALPRGKGAGVAAIACNPKNNTFIASDFIGKIQCYDVRSGAACWLDPFQSDSNYVSCLVFSPDGKTFLSAYNNQFSPTLEAFTEMVQQPSSGKGLPLRLHDAVTGKVLKSFGTGVNAACFSPDGKWVAGNENNEIRIWNVNDGSLFYSSDDPMVNCMAFSPDSKSLLIGYANNNLHLYNLESPNPGFLRADFIGHLSSIRQVGFSPDGKYIISGSNDNTARVWDTAGKELIRLISIGNKDWMVMTPDGLFDASPAAMKMLYLVKGLEIIELDQIKQRYYMPGLLQKVFSPERITLRKTDGYEDLLLFPEMNASIANDILTVHLKPRSGGLGAVSMYINNIEVKADINPNRDTVLKEPLKTYARYYTSIASNTISLRAFNSEGWLKSQAVEVPYEPQLLSGRGGGDDSNTASPCWAMGNRPCTP
ncbi:MAG: WD40 repeat domain-containing protein [Lewinellaceae bacterium]|nr:WD40 repeat domain-containing protein [Lewinellaceae bacterium]